MSVLYEITHRTVYRYSEPVRFGEHRVLFRPRDSHDLHVLATDLRTDPPAAILLIQDPNSNSVALVQPLAPAARLEIISTFSIEHAHTNNLELPVSDSARLFPLVYGVDDRLDLEPFLRPHHEDPQGVLTAWARQFVHSTGASDTRDILVRMNRHIGDTLRYETRNEEGTQEPLATLALGSGTCRDFSLLMMEAIRRLGIAARFVSGYLYDASLEGAGPAMVGSGSTHAWLQAYLPGAGWVPFDPTNNLLGGTQHIRVGVARHPAQAAPVSGSWYGNKTAYLGMDVEVRVARVDPAPKTAPALERPVPSSADAPDKTK
ncbi:Transglutaminase, N-terminal domain protein [Rubrivivax sp. A210]|uniref:transglutaminase family protein n=1 Tax=Rubrivivax sp. A210 TaxID=2772301 RepID=UPI00191A5C73|nr:transglutaminase family protein [Rubrivivax sp. A210]CAD5365962.1 Transglutaminase, N-terminal domain protein [Rubrivivax sp. A210]